MDDTVKLEIQLPKVPDIELVALEGLLSITKFSDIVESFPTVEEAANSF